MSSSTSHGHQHKCSQGIEATDYFYHYHLEEQQRLGIRVDSEKSRRLSEMEEPLGESDENVLEDLESWDRYDLRRRESQTRGVSPLATNSSHSTQNEDGDSDDDSDWTDEWSEDGWEFSEHNR